MVVSILFIFNISFYSKHKENVCVKTQTMSRLYQSTNLILGNWNGQKNCPAKQKTKAAKESIDSNSSVDIILQTILKVHIC